MSTKMINTFIFFDLETTGLIRGNLMPKITEMSLIAVSRNAICNARGALPRVLQKLVLAINPGTTIPKAVENLTGLSNDHLEHVKCFSHDTFDLFIKFLRIQKEPVCFVAYNGNKFDYPVLLSELKNIGQTLSEDILSIDMMCLVREFFSSKDHLKPAYDHLLNDGCDEALAEILDDTMRSIVEISDDNDSEVDVRIIYDAREDVRPFAGATDSPRNRMKTTAGKTNTLPSNLQLKTVYQHICESKTEGAHTAEGDSESMIHCAVRIDNFVKWADKKALPLITFRKI